MKHEILEKNVGLLALCMAVAVSIGGLTQIVPLFFQDVTNTPVEGMKPYTALQLEGRDIYIREGCVGCHSQMIRPFRAETERYGHYSVSAPRWRWPPTGSSRRSRRSAGSRCSGFRRHGWRSPRSPGCSAGSRSWWPPPRGRRLAALRSSSGSAGPTPGHGGPGCAPRRRPPRSRVRPRRRARLRWRR